MQIYLLSVNALLFALFMSTFFQKGDFYSSVLPLANETNIFG